MPVSSSFVFYVCVSLCPCANCKNQNAAQSTLPPPTKAHRAESTTGFLRIRTTLHNMRISCNKWCNCTQMQVSCYLAQARSAHHDTTKHTPDSKHASQTHMMRVTKCQWQVSCSVLDHNACRSLPNDMWESESGIWGVCVHGSVHMCSIAVGPDAREPQAYFLRDTQSDDDPSFLRLTRDSNASIAPLATQI